MYEYFCGNSPFFSTSNVITCQKILSREVFWPPDLDPVVKDLIDKLLTVDMEKRLGCGPGGDADVKQHPYFATINFENLTAQQAPLRVEELKEVQEPEEEPPAPDINLDDDDDVPIIATPVPTKEPEIPEPFESQLYLATSGKKEHSEFKEVYRKSELLRKMYPELKRIPVRPRPVSAVILSQSESVPLAPIPAEKVSIPSSPSASTFKTIVRTKVNMIQPLKAPVRNLSLNDKHEVMAVSGNFFVKTFSTTGKIPAPELNNLNTGSSACYLEWNTNGDMAFDMQRHIGILPKGAKKMKQLKGHKLPITAISFSSLNPHILAACGQDSSTYVWNIKKEKCIAKFATHMNFVNCVQWQPKSNIFATGGADSRLVFYDATTSRIIQKIDYHQNVCKFTSLTFFVECSWSYLECNRFTLCQLLVG